MKGNIIGEPTEEFVKKEVESRQKIYGKGFNKGSLRTQEEINYLNNRNSWIKLASSTRIDDANLRVPKGANSDSLKGINLATQAILFNGLSSLQDTTLSQRSGVERVKNSYFNNSVYGLGGTEFGIQPMPGINSIQVDTKNRGSIRSATIDLIAFNRFQFEVIETLYLRLGFTLLLEWGWDKYIDWEDGNKIKNVGSTLVENGFFTSTNQDTMLTEIKSFQQKYKGNYDGFFGRVVNFNWQFQNDGSYKITIKLASLGDVIESLKINQSPSQELKDQVESLGEGSNNNRFTLLRDAKSAIYNNKATTKLGAALYKKLSGDEFFGKDSTNNNYYNLYWAIASSTNYSSIGRKNLDIQYCYYIKFGELCNIIEKEILPNVNNSTIKHLEFDLSTEHTICSYYPNLVSFDPKVCIINAHDDIVLNQDTISNINRPDYLNKLPSFAIKLAGSSDSLTPTYTITYTQPPPAGTVGTAQQVVIPNALGPYDPSTSTYIDSNNKPVTITSYNDVESQQNPDTIQKGDLVYGKIYNIYLNYDAVFKSLKNNVDKKGNLTLFKFLQDICDKINSSFANTLDIECMIKDDKKITFLDQKPVMGLSKRFKHPNFDVRDANDTAEIEVYGFNPSKEEGSFLKSISFNTKLSPKLSNQLSIGATARGVSVGEDSTGFSNWNKGLVDRFQETIDDPIIEEGEGGDGTNNGTGSGNKGESTSIIRYEGDDSNLKQWIGPLTTQKTSVTISFTLSDINVAPGQGSSAILDLTFTGEMDTKTGKLTTDLSAPYKYVRSSRTYTGNYIYYKTGTSVKNMYDKVTEARVGGSSDSRNTQKIVYKEVTNAMSEAFGAGKPNFGIDLENHWGWFGTKGTISARTSEQNKQQQKAINDAKKKLSGLNYSAYLAAMFGGQPDVTVNEITSAGIDGSNIPQDKSLYPSLKSGEDFSEAGRASYKIYLNEWSAGLYSGGDSATGPSNQIGMIPVEFDMEMDGISGFRIYNKVSINQDFLPSNYANALEFLVKGLNHKVDSSGWATNLQTLSTSNLNAAPIKSNRAASSPRRTKPITQKNSRQFPPDTFVGSPDLQPIKDLIAKYESNGNYSIANQGSRGGYRISTTNVTTKTANQLVNELSTTYTDKEVTDVVFAMGRYQVIPKVLKEAVTAGAIKENDLFDKSNQEKVCDYLLLAKRNSQIGKYLRGENGGSQEDLESAIQGLGQEWASMPCVKNQQGQSVGNVNNGSGNAGYYGGDGINPSVAKVNVGTAVQKMIESRIKFSKNQPSYIPSYVTV